MRLLQRKFDVETRYGGGFVQKIDGVARRAPQRPPGRLVLLRQRHRGRRGAAARAARAGRPRVVGPPRLGRRDARPRGRRLLPRAVRVGVEGQAGAGADRLRRRARGARATRCRAARARRREGRRHARRSAAGGGGVLRVLVGRWADVRRDPAARRIERGPKVSGVYARPRAGGRPARPARRARARWCGRSAPGAGLVAATRFGDAAADLGRHGHRRRRRRRRGRRAGGEPAARPLRGRDRERPARSRCRLPAGSGAVTYRRRASPLHAARAGVGALFCVVARRAWRCRSSTRSCSARCCSRVLRPAPRPASAALVARRCCFALPFALLIALVNALVVRDGPDGDRAARRRCRCSGGSTSRSRRPPTAACSACARWSWSAASRCTRAASTRTSCCARSAACSLPLRADRGAGDPHGAGAGARRAPPRATPSAAAPASPRSRGRSCAPSPRARSTARSTSPPRSRSAATARRAARRAQRAAVVAPRPRLRRRLRSRSPRSASARRSSAWAAVRGLPAARGAGRRAACRARRRAGRPARCCRSPTGGGSGGERARRSTRVTYRYPGVAPPALRDVSLASSRASSSCWPAASGSGKSTLLRAAGGLVPHFHGGEFAGRLLGGRPRHARARAGRARRGRRHAVPGSRDAGRDGDGARRAGVPAREPRLGRRRRSRAGWRRRRSRSGSRGLLDRSTHELSGGELQRVALGAALAGRPRLLLLDEPTSQLDPVAGDELLGVLRRLNEEWGTAVVLAEHRLDRCLGRGRPRDRARARRRRDATRTRGLPRAGAAPRSTRPGARLFASPA